METKTMIAVRQPVNPHSTMIIRPVIRLAAVFINVHAPTVCLGCLRVDDWVRLFANAIHWHGRLPDRFYDARLFLCRRNFLTRLWFRTNHRLRLANLWRMIHRRLWLRTWCRLLRCAAVVSVKSAPLGAGILAKRAQDQQYDWQSETVNNRKFHKHNYFSFEMVECVRSPIGSSVRISITNAPEGRSKTKSESAMRPVRFQCVINAVNSGAPGSFL